MKFLTIDKEFKSFKFGTGGPYYAVSETAQYGLTYIWLLLLFKNILIKKLFIWFKNLLISYDNYQF